MRAWFGVTGFLLTLNKQLFCFTTELLPSKFLHGPNGRLIKIHSILVFRVCFRSGQTLVLHDCCTFWYFECPRDGVTVCKIVWKFSASKCWCSLYGGTEFALEQGHCFSCKPYKTELRLSRSGFFVICKFKGTLKSKQTKKTWSTVIGNFSLLSIRQENIFDIWLFFPAMHLSLSILQLCFHISGILLLISLMKHHETAFSYLSIFTITAEVLRGNGPSCLDAVKQWLCSLLQDATMPDSHHPCADMCMYHFLHACWQVKCSKEVAHERHWQGTVLRAAGAVWRTAVTRPPQLGSAWQRSYAKEQRWSMVPCPLIVTASSSLSRKD